jgi:hypothetical protein
MTCLNLLTAIVAALRSAGATEEIIAAAVKKGLGHSRMPQCPREADGASTQTARPASALGGGGTKFDKKFPGPTTRRGRPCARRHPTWL